MNLSEHFTLEELVASQIAARRRIDNRPPPAIIENLRRVAAVLEQVRALVGRAITVSSGYRSPALNAAAGGARESAHLQGLAADITVSGLAPKDLAKAIVKAGIEFDQLIYEGTWVHIGLAAGKLRGQVLTATFAPGGVVYSVGIA
ncbi:D-Ala-D-Ala carboxypeptidase family metallohydrolase [Duganella sp. CT11-25]|uniref:D-Ala-D-Ala carboxypeptidase family metallohydrolase n=1 Tax=unclassified Duganella TaxID=2636909 RepID=UPI0039B0BEDF